MKHSFLSLSGCNDTIKHLNLSWNHLRGKGAQAIGLGLQVKIIRILDFCNFKSNIHCIKPTVHIYPSVFNNMFGMVAYILHAI